MAHYSLLLLPVYTLIVLCIGDSFALRCHFLSQAEQSLNAASYLNRTRGENITTKSDTYMAEQLKGPYDCPAGDRHCVTLTGAIHNAVGKNNLTFIHKSCESGVRTYVASIGERLGQRIHYKCNENEKGEERDEGAVNYKVLCCNTNLCNAGDAANSAMQLRAVFTTLLAISSFALLLKLIVL